MRSKKVPEPVINDQWSGPFESIPFSAAPHDIFNLIAGYEKEAREFLKSKSYQEEPTDKGAWNKDRRYRDILRMLTYFREVRIYIDMNEAAGAALSMAYAIRCAMLARIRPVEPIIETGKKVVDGGKHGGKKSGVARREKTSSAKEAWRAEAGKIWLNSPKLSKVAVGKIISKRIGGNADTIRKSI